MYLFFILEFFVRKIKEEFKVEKEFFDNLVMFFFFDEV